MQFNEHLDPRFLSLLQTHTKDSDFIYAEQNDSPLYDFLVIAIRQSTLKIIERIDLDEVAQEHQITTSQHNLLAPKMNFGNLCVKQESREKIYGGTWICVFQKGQLKAPHCFKLEAESPTWGTSFMHALSPISRTIKASSLSFRRNWHLMLPTDPNRLGERAKDKLVIDMDLPIKVRRIASAIGVTTASDFAHIDEDTMRASLDTPDADELMKILKLKLRAIGISMNG